MASAEAEFDPRYPAAFQRGYPGDGAPVPAHARGAAASMAESARHRTPTASHRTASADRERSDRETPERENADHDSPASSRVLRPDGVGEEAETSPVADSGFAAPPHRNPFLWVLGVLGVLLLTLGVVGGALASWSRPLQSFSSSMGDVPVRSWTSGSYVVAERGGIELVLIGVWPGALAIGVVTLLGVLFVHAVEWSRRPARRP